MGRYGHTLPSTSDATLKLVLTDIIRQEVSRKALGTVALRGVVVSIAAEDQHRAAQQRRRVEVPGRAALCEDPPARARKNRHAEIERREKTVSALRHIQTVLSAHLSVLLRESASSCQGA